MRRTSGSGAFILLLSLCASGGAQTAPASAPTTAPALESLPFRTDASNPQLPWYKLQPDVFPPVHSEHRVRGELVEADYIHRVGQFRTAVTGDLVSFRLMPYAVLQYHGAEADLRDIPLETELTFFTYQDASGAFTQIAAAQDDFTLISHAGNVTRIETIEPVADKPAWRKLSVAIQKASDPTTAPSATQPVAEDHQSLIVNERTQIWKGDQPAKIEDLKPGDEAEINRGWPEGICTELFIGPDAARSATARQRKVHGAFIADRGVAGWIERVEGKKIVVSLFGDPEGQAIFFKEERIVPAQWATEHKRLHVVVANQDLRTYNPPVDGQGSDVLSYQAIATDNYGSTGVQWTLQPSLLLEGFRHGHIVRIFANPSWKHEDMPYGEKIYDESDRHLAEASPNQYPFRTDFGNEELPWYQYVPGHFAPWGSEHNINGELLSVDLLHRTGKFRTDSTGETVDFEMLPPATVQYLGADAELQDLPIGTRYQFSMLQDQTGKFTRVVQITDDFTQQRGRPILYRVEMRGDDATPFFLEMHPPKRNDDKDHLIQPPDLGRGVFSFDAHSQIVKGDQHLSMGDLATGDDMVMNQSGATQKSRGQVTAAFVGEAAQKAAVDQQRERHAAYLKQQGMAAWVESVSADSIVINFFAANRRDFDQALGQQPNWEQTLSVLRADDALRSTGAAVLKFGLRDRMPEGPTFDTFGCSGIRWRLGVKPENSAMPADLKPGDVLRVYKSDWPLPVATPAPASAPAATSTSAPAN